MSKRLVLAIYLSFCIVAVLLSSVGVVIMGMVNDFGIDKTEASILEAFKDFTIVLSAFLISSFIPRLGYKNSMLLGLGAMGLGCLIMPILNGFLAAKLMLAMTGFSFMVLKVGVYSLVGLYATDDKTYTSTISIIEGFFGFSMMIGTSLFGFFILLKELGYTGFLGQGWVNSFWLLAALCVFAFFLLRGCAIDEAAIKPDKNATALTDMKGMWSLLTQPSVIAFALCVFTYGFLEQAVSNWLPKLYNDVFLLSESTAVFLAGSWPLSIAVGRLGWGHLMKYIDWFKVLLGGLIAGLLLMMSVSKMIATNPTATLITVPFTNISVPLAALLLPLIGLFIGAIYPTISASLLNSLHKSKHSPTTGWSIIFYAMGGAIGSRVLAMIYQNVSGVEAIDMLTYPIVILLIVIFPFSYLTKRGSQ